eukprot:scaffold214605_cov15-Tisochrysis_lutea.AAC.1
MAPYLSKFLPLCARRLEGCPFKPFQTVCGIKFNCFLQLVGKDCALDFIIIYGQLNMPTANANCKGTTLKKQIQEKSCLRLAGYHHGSQKKQK